MESGGRSRGLRDFPLEQGLPPAAARGEGDWRVVETVGDILRGRVWTRTDRLCDFG